MSVRTISKLLAVALVASFTACDGPGLTGVDKPASILGGVPGWTSTPKLLECPATTSSTTSAVVSPLGGLVALGEASILIPAGALLSDALVTVTVPASKYVEVDISVEGQEHFLFELPVTVTISYARCSRSNIDLLPLSAWYIDSETKQMLEKMPSIDNKLLRTVTFTTGHLSGYAIAN